LTKRLLIGHTDTISRKCFLDPYLFVWRSQALSLIFKPLRQLERLFQVTEARNGFVIRGKVVWRFQ
jgi:hypothetical protein